MFNRHVLLYGWLVALFVINMLFIYRQYESNKTISMSRIICKNENMLFIAIVSTLCFATFLTCEYNRTPIDKYS